MRALIVLISTAFLAALGFLIYWEMFGADTLPGGQEKKHAAATRSALPTTLPTSSGSTIGPGEGVWWDRYDSKTGERTSRLRAVRYDRRADGRLAVVAPEAEFFLHNGQVLRLRGKRGLITMQESISRGKSPLGPAANSTAQTPRSGDLYDVVLTVFETIQAPLPKLTMTMDNASFDNETFRIQTEDSIGPGQKVRADQIPVTVRGDDYDFDGKGMRLQYDEVNRRLQFLKIFHGQRLLIKHPGAMQDSTRKRQAAVGRVTDPAVSPVDGVADPALSSAESAFVRLFRPIPGSELAAADRAAAGAAAKPVRKKPVAAPPPSTRAAAGADDWQPVYRATFNDNVVVLQGGQKLAVAEQMQVDYLSESDEVGGLVQATATRPAGAGPVVKKPATRPANANTAGSPRVGMANKPTTRPALAGKSPTPATTQPGRTTTQPVAEQPIEIQWTGPLTIVPLGGEPPDRIAPSESIIRLFGSAQHPVEVTHESESVKSTMRCFKLTHWTFDQSALLEDGPGVLVEMMDSRKSHIITHRMEFSQADGLARLYGKSHAELPIEEGTGPATRPVGMDVARVQLMKADWNDRCTMIFEGGGMEDMIIRRADLQGAVNVDHPQLSMLSDNLTLFFATDDPPVAIKPATKPATTGPAIASKRQAPPLKQLDANGNVKCVMRNQEPGAQPQKIDCDNLKLATALAADGSRYARNIVALGKVHVIDPERDVRCGTLDIKLAPPGTGSKATTKPAAARGLKDASLTTGDLESLIAHDDVHIVTADGKKADADQMSIQVRNGRTEVTLTGRPAIVTREKDKLMGPVIFMIPDTQELIVTGGGRMEGQQQGEAGKPPRPVLVTWENSLTGRGNTIECLGNVSAQSIDADGAVNIARGRRVVITTTQPATPPATQPVVKPPAVQPVASAKKPTTRPGDLDAMSNRQIESMTLEGSAQVTSTLSDAKGVLQRLMHLDAETIQFFQPTPTTRKLVIPVPGRMLFVDNRAPAPGSTPAKEAATDPMGVRGRTAFQWGKSLVYDGAKEQVTMSGTVQMARVDPTADQVEPMRLVGDTLVADLEPQTASTTQPAPAAGIGDISSKMQLRKVHVEGDVVVTGKQLNIEAQSMDYDPVAHLMTARGSPRKPVRQLDANGLETARFDRFVWNTVKSQIVDSENAVFINRK